MRDIKKVYEKYVDIDIGDLSNNNKDEMRSILRNIHSEDLKDIREHKMFLELLNKFRMSNIKDMERIGDGFLKTLRSLLTVGEDGVYSNSHRFLYELIQNVDDCEYKDVNDCNLDIRFIDHMDSGRIILTYNEEGFTPRNVFDITGIAEKSKNISEDKVEIGEKGIGFKSVFGIADRVRIESGLFSFELNRDSFTVPVPQYEDFTPVKGSRLTLEMSAYTVNKVYRSIVERYMDRDAALNKNPILFLNKLTHLRLYYDGYRYIEFDIERKIPALVGDIAFEDNLIISVDMRDCYEGADRKYSSNISCRRYVKSLVYGEKECRSRYGEDALFSERRHNLIAIFPKRTYELKNFKGMLYSFLPTQIQMTAPIVLHVPFKLDGSREFVDSQGKNEWFEYTIENLAEFLKKIYIHLSRLVKQDIVYYIPGFRNYFFEQTNEKIKCLILDQLMGNSICEERVFLTADGSFENADNIVSFDKDEKISDPIKVFSLLDDSRKLFIPNAEINMRVYGVNIISNVSSLLFKVGLKDESKFSDIANVLDIIGNKVDYLSLIEECCPLSLSRSQLLVISKHKKIYLALNKYGEKCIKGNRIPEIVLEEGLIDAEKNIQNEIIELLTSADIDKNYKKYLKMISHRFRLLEGINQEFAIAGKNAIVLAEGMPMDSFVSLTDRYDSNKVFVSSLRIRQASERLNEVDDSMSDEEFLKLLRSVRVSIKDAYGVKTYNNYIHIINQAGMDKNRFINELLQNADDCEYPEEADPAFDLKIDGNTITVFYNEIGFSKQNVRAITAIGESTKKILENGIDNSIGEKGVGFKSVFGVAESVEIHSNNFNFKLTDKMPTVPEKCDQLKGEKIYGTTLFFNMKVDVIQALNEDKLLRLCLCLRNLKYITIQGTKIHIFDTEDERIIFMGDKSYHFEKFTYDFRITDTYAIEERAANRRLVSESQSIYFYIPKNYKKETYPLYAGLPTSVDCNIPVIIDAPFELTTSRDYVSRCRWNEMVKESIYSALLELMKQKRDELKIDVLKYVKFAAQYNSFKYTVFSDEYLNYFDWTTALSNAEIIPVFNQNKFVSGSKVKCLIVPDVVAYIMKNFDIHNNYDGVIVDTYHKSQYLSVLYNIGCIRSSIWDDISCIRSAVSYIGSDENFRDVLYRYFTNSDTQDSLRSKKLYDDVKSLPIFPIRIKSGVKYVPFSKKIYTHDTRESDNDFLILENKIMNYETLYTILGGEVRVNELTSEVYEARYQKNLVSYIRDSSKSNKEKAWYILNEFNNNRPDFQRCSSMLRGIIGEIPMETLSGKFKTGNKFVNKRGLIFSGATVRGITVAESFKALAEYLGCTDVIEIHYDDLDLKLDSVSDEDIEDFQSEFFNSIEILEKLIKDCIISDEQIERFRLEFLDNDDGDDFDEDFPGRMVTNLPRLIAHIRNQFITNPNPYVERQRIVHEPENPVDKESYTFSMYGSEYNSKKCFCQMCKKMVPNTYIERNDVQRLPEYGWAQMYLSLCLQCSKDYKLRRNNEIVWEKFIRNILEADVLDKETVDVEFGDKTMTFTATHLAEIQAILKVEQDNKE